MNSFWDKVYLNNSLHDWLTAFVIIISLMLFLRFIQAVVISRIKKLASHTKTNLDDLLIGILQSTIMPLLYILSVYYGLQYLVIPAKLLSILHVSKLVVITFFILKLLTGFIRYSFHKAIVRQEGNELRKKQANGFLLIVQVLLWGLGILFIIDNLGYDITTLIAGLGIGGIAIALAAQTILADLFSYLVIFFDKPFEIGDFIIVEDKMGNVEYIGIKTTHIRTLGGEQLIFSNTDLTNSRVHNYKRMNERRVIFHFGIVYDTHKTKLEEVPSWTRTIIENLERTRFDRAHFKSFGDFSLDFEVVYYVLSSDYNQFMDIQQQINLQLFALFEKEGVQFAFPTQTVYVSGNDSKNVQKKQAAYPS